MNFTNNFAVESLGWMLVHSVWLLSLPALVCAIVLLLIPQRHSQTRYATALASLLMMSLLPLGTLFWLPTPETAEMSSSATLEAEPPLRVDDRPREYIENVTNFGRTESVPPQPDFQNIATIVKPELSEMTKQSASPDSAVVTMTSTAVAEVQTPTLWQRFRLILPLVVAMWFVGVLMMTLRLLLGLNNARRLRHNGSLPVPKSVERLFGEIGEQLHVSRATRVMQSTLVKIPSVVGHFRPIVLLPISAVTGLSTEQLRAILAHELAHVRRYDYAVNILQNTIETVWFYHPAVWWISHIVRGEREHCCDRLAMAAGCPAAELASALVIVAGVDQKMKPCLFESDLIPASDGGDLLRRIRRIANVPTDDRLSRRPWLAGLLVLGMMILITSMFYAEQTVTVADEVDQAGENVRASSDDVPAQNLDEFLSSAPVDVPLPIDRFPSYKNKPPSGSGLRVHLDSRRWVELNSLSATEKIDGEDVEIFWKADGELIDPPEGFNPLTLVPALVNDEMPKVLRGVSLQVVGPKGIRVSMSTSGFGGYGNFQVPVNEEFVQIPLGTIMSDIPYNQAFVEVRVSQEKWEEVPLNSSKGMQIIQSPEDRSLYVVIHDARTVAWQLEITGDDAEPIVVSPTMVGGNPNNPYFPATLQDSVPEELQSAEVVGFVFDKEKPMPKLLKLQRSPYDFVRFDNLSVFPGPKSAVRVTVNGAAISEEQQPTLTPKDGTTRVSTTLDDLRIQDEKLDLIPLQGTVVDAKGEPVPDCWVGMFVTPQEYEDSSVSSEPFVAGPPLAYKSRTDADGKFSIVAQKTHFVFEGSFWAVREDGATGTLSMNCVWPYLQNHLKIRIAEEQGTVRVVDPKGEPIVGAKVTLEAVKIPRSVTRQLPGKVQTRQTAESNDEGEVTFLGWSSAAIRGVAVTAEGFGTQYLNHRYASQWVKGKEPLVLTLHPTASLSGQVLGYEDSKLEGLQLQILTETRGTMPPLAGRAVVNIDDEGRFSVDHIAAGWASLLSSLTHDSPIKMQIPHIPILEVGEDREIQDNPQLVPAVTVRQQIIRSDTKAGIPDLKLRVLWGSAVEDGSWRESKPTTTDKNGWWTAHVLPGPINIRISSVPDGYAGTAWFDGRNGRLGIEAEIPATDQFVTLPPEVYVPSKKLSGRLQYADGSPAQDWSVYGHPISWKDVGVGGVRTNQEGRFTWTYPTGYRPRLYKASNRTWLTDHHFTDLYVIPKVLSTDPFVLEIPEKPDTEKPDTSE